MKLWKKYVNEDKERLGMRAESAHDRRELRGLIKHPIY